MARGHIRVVRDFIVPRLINVCTRARPNIFQVLQKLKFFPTWESQLAHRLSDQSANKLWLPLADELALIYLIGIIFSRGVNGRMFVAPALLLLDGWSADLSQMHKSDFYPISKTAVLESLQSNSPPSDLEIKSAQNSQSIRESQLLPSVAEDKIYIGLCLLGLHLMFLESTCRYSSVILPLACGLLSSAVHSSLPSNRIEEIVIELSSAIRAIISLVQKVNMLQFYYQFLMSC